MSKKTGLSTLDVIISLALIVVLAVVLMPITRSGRGSVCKTSSCQSNITQVGRAFKMYLSDWDDTYPTNRIRLRNGKLGTVTDHLNLSVRLGRMPHSGNRFKYGVNWVEGLYSYVEAAASSTDASTVWRCTSASDATYPTDSKTACISYVFNRNLVEKRRDIITTESNLMIAREADRLLNADLRPTNNSIGSPKKMPISAFLKSKDIKMGKTNGLLHGRGSHILFADGHVKFCDTVYFPSKPQWDPETRQWYNFVSSQNRTLDKSIAITP